MHSIFVDVCVVGKFDVMLASCAVLFEHKARQSYEQIGVFSTNQTYVNVVD